MNRVFNQSVKHSMAKPRMRGTLAFPCWRHDCWKINNDPLSKGIETMFMFLKVNVAYPSQYVSRIKLTVQIISLWKVLEDTKIQNSKLHIIILYIKRQALDSSHKHKSNIIQSCECAGCTWNEKTKCENDWNFPFFGWRLNYYQKR